MSLIEMSKAARKRQLRFEQQIDDTLSGIIRTTDFSLSENARRQLLAYSYTFFEEWDGDTNRQYQRGDVVRVGEWKWMIQNNGNINPNPLESGLTKLFRSIASHDEDDTPREWIREEFCISGMERMYNGKWYQVIASVVDDATPPPNNQAAWKELVN